MVISEAVSLYKWLRYSLNINMRTLRYFLITIFAVLVTAVVYDEWKSSLLNSYLSNCLGQSYGKIVSEMAKSTKVRVTAEYELGERMTVLVPKGFFNVTRFLSRKKGCCWILLLDDTKIVRHILCYEWPSFGKVIFDNWEQSSTSLNMTDDKGNHKIESSLKAAIEKIHIKGRSYTNDPVIKLLMDLHRRSRVRLNKEGLRGFCVRFEIDDEIKKKTVSIVIPDLSIIEAFRYACEQFGAQVVVEDDGSIVITKKESTIRNENSSLEKSVSQ